MSIVKQQKTITEAFEIEVTNTTRSAHIFSLGKCLISTHGERKKNRCDS